jgi:hypothetical protein
VLSKVILGGYWAVIRRRHSPSSSRVGGDEKLLESSVCWRQQAGSLRAMVVDFESDARCAAVLVTGLDEVGAQDFVVRVARFPGDARIAIHRGPLESP